MIKSSMLYRRLWYVRKRNTKNIHIYSRLITVIIIFSLLITYVQKQSFPYLIEISKWKVKEQIGMIINEAIKNSLLSQLKYEDLIKIDRNQKGIITSLQIESNKATEISSEIADLIQNRLSSMPLQKLDLPLGVLSGKTIFSGLGPAIHIAYKPFGNVKTSIQSNFSSVRINQTRHLIYIRIELEYSISIPLDERKYKLNTDIPLLETIIIGSVPDGYSNPIKK